MLASIYRGITIYSTGYAPFSQGTLATGGGLLCSHCLHVFLLKMECCGGFAAALLTLWCLLALLGLHVALCGRSQSWYHCWLLVFDCGLLRILCTPLVILIHMFCLWMLALPQHIVVNSFVINTGINLAIKQMTPIPKATRMQQL